MGSNGEIEHVRGADIAPLEFDATARRILRDTYARDASDAEFAGLLSVAEARGLDPRIGHVHFVKRYDSKSRREVWATQASIDGLRAIAERTGLYDGQDEPEYETDDDGTPVLARVRVYRKGISRPFVGVARWSEYVQRARPEHGEALGRPTRFWASMPFVMLGKCAEALALRKAIPQQTAGLYTPEEMAQAENDRHAAPKPRTIAAALGGGDAWLARIDGAQTIDDLRAVGVALKGADASTRTAVRGAYESRLAMLREPSRVIDATPEPEPTHEREPGEDDDAPAQMSALDAWRARVAAYTTPQHVAASWAAHRAEFTEHDVDAARDATLARLSTFTSVKDPMVYLNEACAKHDAKGGAK